MSILLQYLFLSKSKYVVFGEKLSWMRLREGNTHLNLILGRTFRRVVINPIAPYDRILRVLHLLNLFLDLLLILILIFEVSLHFGPVIFINQVVVFIPSDCELIDFFLSLLWHGASEAVLA